MEVICAQVETQFTEPSMVQYRSYLSMARILETVIVVTAGVPGFVLPLKSALPRPCIAASIGMDMFWAFVGGLITGVMSALIGVLTCSQQEAQRPQSEQWWIGLSPQARREQLLQRVEHHARALRDLGLPWEVEEYNDGHVVVYTTLPGMGPIGQIFQRYGDCQGLPGDSS